MVGAIALVPAANAEPSAISSLQGSLQDAIAPGHWIGQFVGINSKTERWEFAGSNPQKVSAALVDVLNELTPERRTKLLIPEFRISQADSSKVHVLTWTKNEWLDSLDVRLEARSGAPAVNRAWALCVLSFAWYPYSQRLRDRSLVAQAADASPPRGTHHRIPTRKDPRLSPHSEVATSDRGSAEGRPFESHASGSFYATGFLPTSIPLAPLANVALAWIPFGSPGPRGQMLQDFRLRAVQGLLVRKLNAE